MEASMAGTTKASTRSIPNRIRTAHAAMVREALRTWRRWAADAAADGTIPSPTELIATAAILGIESPGTALEQDAASLREYEAVERGVEGCHRAVAEAIAPWGDRDKLEAAIDAAEREVKRLRDVRDLIDIGGSYFYWSSRRSEIKRGAKRVLAHEDEVLALLQPSGGGTT